MTAASCKKKMSASEGYRHCDVFFLEEKFRISAQKTGGVNPAGRLSD